MNMVCNWLSELGKNLVPPFCQSQEKGVTWSNYNPMSHPHHVTSYKKLDASSIYEIGL